ncbi:restriction endonuclease subunit S [Neiella marina]|uniref:Restriction endonuclease subunit S n=1 Tax=Neiella holothuriorum TaxID=2870530 RepID=A0ABS7ED76_9GAMM|nr:restriction endonuclease subunit S [Neiella holothuriorum]MBW8190293.1 restriction endonuclease subunit S [Neiella holothuriorum]
MSWPLIKLSDVVQVNPRCPRDIDEFQNVSFVAMASASEEGFLLTEETRVLGETKKGFTYFEKEDVLLAKITPCFENGKSLRPNQITHAVGFGSTEFHVLRADQSKVDSTYLFYMISGKPFRFLGERSMAGAAGQKRVGADFIKNFEIPLPPLDEQKRIAAILDKADAIRRKRQQAIQLADDFLRSVFLDMFGDPVTNPKGWEMMPVKDVAEVTTGNTPSRKVPEYYGGKMEWIKSDNINTPEHFLTKATEFLSDDGLKVARTVPKGSTLITCIAGSFDCIGNAAFANREVAFNQQINALTPKEGMLSWFLYALILFSKKAIQSASTNSMKGMVSKGKLEEVRLIVPPIEQQQKFEDIFNNQIEMVAKLRTSSSGIDDCFNSLSQCAFSGQL